MIEILTPIEVSELFRLSPERVIKMARQGEIPFLIVDGHVRFEAADIEDWVKARKVGTAPLAAPRTVNP